MTKVVPNPLDQAAPLQDQWAQADYDSDLVSSRFGKIHVIPVAAFSGPTPGFGDIVYRIFEISVALVGLALGFPLILAAAALIRLDSPGPALFLHKRPARSIRTPGRKLVGRADLIPPLGGYDPDEMYYVPAYFTLAKMRTMYIDAQTRFPSHYAYNFSHESFHREFPTLQDDPRVTRVGRLLRKLSIDELPNLWSVVIGEMSLVGPRPEAPQVLQYYTAKEMIKFTVKPGITGLAQIGGRGLLNWGQTIALDLEYVRMRSMALDIRIILLTIKRVLTRHGAF